MEKPQYNIEELMDLYYFQNGKVYDHLISLQEENEKLRSALQAARNHVISWQGEPNEFSCQIHAAVVNEIDNALKE